MRRNAKAEGLANYVTDQAIQIGVRRSHIAGGIFEEHLTTPYTNHIDWSNIAKFPNSDWAYWWKSSCNPYPGEVWKAGIFAEQIQE